MDKLTVREITLFGILGALTFAAKYVMAFLPNIEPVSLMVMLFAVIFGKKSLYPIFIYLTMDILFYGLGIWNIMYVYIWPLLGFLAYCFRDMQPAIGWAMLSGIFGLMFGALCVPVDLAVGGFCYALSKWISGIPFDIAHCIGNFAMALLLFSPLRKLLAKLHK